jgi:hypothetical protein
MWIAGSPLSRTHAKTTGFETPSASVRASRGRNSFNAVALVSLIGRLLFCKDVEDALDERLRTRIAQRGEELQRIPPDGVELGVGRDPVLGMERVAA